MNVSADGKPRADSRLKTLPEERQAAIFEYLLAHTYEEAVAWLRADGVKTSRNAVFQFREWYQDKANYEAAGRRAENLVELLKGQQPEISAAELEKYARLAFETEAVRQQDREGWLALKTAQHQAEMAERTLGLKEQELKLKQAKFRRETCALFLAWAEDQRAKAVLAGSGSNAEKIERLGQLMFGDDWNES